MVNTIAILILVAAALTQQPTPVPKESSQFDFWVGTWNCSGESIGADGKATPTQAKNRITRDFDGHVLREEFTMGQFKGTSMSVYQPAAQQWRQTWVDNQGGYIVLTGKFANGKMVLQTLPFPKQPNAASRMTFENITKDSFDWNWEATTDGGKTWKLSWHLKYVRSR
jgi:hypothetical protein